MSNKDLKFAGADRSKRNRNDFYQTPFSMTQQLLDNFHISLNSRVLEPSCGKGAIVDVLLNNGIQSVEYSDLSHGIDFLEMSEDRKYNYVITNPPFSISDKFIEKAMRIANVGIFLLPLNYLHGKKRYDSLYNNSNFKLSNVFVFTRYPLLTNELREDGLYKTGMIAYAWYVFKKEYEGPTELNFIDNSKYILKSK